MKTTGNIKIKSYGIFTLFGIAFFILKTIGYLEEWSWWWLLPLLLGDILLVAIILIIIAIFNKD